MNKYELAVVIDGETSAAKKKAVVELVEKLLTTLKGRVGKVEEWKKRDLASKIGKSTTGIHLFFPIEMPGEMAAQIDSKLRMEKDILRYMLVTKK